jgi:hypothetical protein
MNNNSTSVSKYFVILTLLAFLSHSAVYSQTSSIAANYKSFDAASDHNAVTLSWSISNNGANDNFEVERSFDLVTFSTAAYVLGALPTSDGVEQFSFRDKDKRIVNHAVVYYRLKQVDASGNATYSNVETVRMNNSVEQPQSETIVAKL